jgi:hypothetical protein
MRKWATFVYAALLVAAVVLASGALADISSDPKNPVVIPYDQTVVFSVVGSNAGGFAYYAIDYPGDGRVVSVEVQPAPGDSVVMNAVGVNLYGQFDGYFLGTSRAIRGFADREAVMYSDDQSGRWLIQVFNYLHNVPVQVSLTVKGLKDAPVVEAPQPVVAPPRTEATSSGSGSLMGNRAGSFHYYYIDTPPTDRDVKIVLDYWPDNVLISKGFGFNVYGPEGGVLVAHGNHEATFRPDRPGQYLVQVYNYVHAVNISYALYRQ